MRREVIGKCVSFIFLGAVLIVAGLLLGGKLNWNYGFFNGKFKSNNGKVYEDKLEVSEFSNIKLDSDTVTVRVKAEGDKYRVEYHVQDYEPVVSVENDTLTVNQKEKGNLTIGFNISSSDNYINVYVPEGSEFKDVDLENDTGSLTVESIKCDKLTVSEDTGRLKVENCECKDGKFKNDTGSLTIKDLTADEAVIENDTGRIKVSDSDIKSIDCDNDTGSVKIEDTKADKVKVTVDTGSTNISLIGNIDDYGFKFKSDTGSIKVNGEKQSKSYEVKTSGDKKVEVKSSTGSITCDIND